jgi:hypothetical protein
MSEDADILQHEVDDSEVGYGTDDEVVDDYAFRCPDDVKISHGGSVDVVDVTFVCR